MVALNFNAANVKPNTALEPVPTGIYPVIITRTEEKPTKAGTGTYIEIEMQIQAGPGIDPAHAGRKVFDRLNTNNPNPQAVEIAYSTLSAICHVTGVMQLTDTTQLHGRPFMVVVQKVEREDRPGTYSNEVKGYKDINGNDPGFGGQVTQQGGQPGWANGQQAQQSQPQVQPQQAAPAQATPAAGQQPPSWAAGAPAQGAAPQTQQGAPSWAQG